MEKGTTSSTKTNKIFQITAATLFVSLALVLPAKGTEPQGGEMISEGSNLYSSHSGVYDQQVAFMNPTLMSPSTFGEFPGSFRPPQCPYDTWSRPVHLPLLGHLDVKLFCVPKEENGKTTGKEKKHKP